MSISAFDLFKIGIGPSSSHTVGPMVAARTFVHSLDTVGLLQRTGRVTVELFGSLGATGRGHGSPRAILLGLEGETPENVQVDAIADRVAGIRASRKLSLLGRHPIAFDEKQDLVLHKRRRLPHHPNGMAFAALDESGEVLSRKLYYSVGGGFVIDNDAISDGCIIEDETRQAFPFSTAAELLAHCERERLPISEIMLRNETAWRSEKEIRAGLLQIRDVMAECIASGCRHEGTLPGGLNLGRRAPRLYRQLSDAPADTATDPLSILDWIGLYALAVNEENAAGGRVVTAPTNGAAGIIPAVLQYYSRFCAGADDEGAVRYLLTAAAIGILYKENASISGAEVGCQGEVGSACSMAAGALTEVLGGTPAQVENAAEIGMEHNLGLTCDPIGGLVQVPCIERNAMAAVKAVNAARMALRGDGTHYVSLDKVINTMRLTGRDMKDKYKETARGGLALNVLEVPVNIVEC